MEQLESNALIRPLSEYVGVEQRSVSASETLDDGTENAG
jgi:citrate synthase